MHGRPTTNFLKCILGTIISYKWNISVIVSMQNDINCFIFQASSIRHGSTKRPNLALGSLWWTRSFPIIQWRPRSKISGCRNWPWSLVRDSQVDIDVDTCFSVAERKMKQIKTSLKKKSMSSQSHVIRTKMEPSAANVFPNKNPLSYRNWAWRWPSTRICG